MAMVIWSLSRQPTLSYLRLNPADCCCLALAYSGLGVYSVARLTCSGFWLPSVTENHWRFGSRYVPLYDWSTERACSRAVLQRLWRKIATHNGYLPEPPIDS